jgi:uncharacterized repeat protein (TIGR03806 family)
MIPEKPKCRGNARTALLVSACLWAGLPFHAAGQVGGLDAPQVVGAFFNNTFPQSAPGSLTGWQAVNAFPNLTFVDPLWLTGIPGTNQLLLVGKNGQLWRFENNPAVTQAQVVKVLEWVNNTQSSEDQGFYSIAFHPQFGQAGSPNANYAYVCYNHKPALSGAGPNFSYWRVSRFTWQPATGTLDPASEYVLMNQYDRCRWHNGGATFFGNDGFLYINCGDGGDSTQGDGLHGVDGALSRTQRLNGGLFSGVFRIDVDNDPAKSHAIRRQPQSPANKPAGWPASSSQGYGIPNDNPWLDAGGSILEEYWSLGLRSPHTMHFDGLTGDIWIGDVGESSREEMTRAPKGSNAQWGFKEGSVNGPGTLPSPVIGVQEIPGYDYSHSVGGCIIGGMRYRGAKWDSLLGGKLLFGDHLQGRVWTATLNPGGGAPVIEEIVSGLPIGGKIGLANFCTDSGGEIFLPMVNGTNKVGGTIYKLTSAGVSTEPPQFLSQTGVFTSLTSLATAPGVIPYNVANPLWSDAAAKKRWIILPNNGAHDTAAEKIVFSEEGNWQFPAGTVFVKHFEVALDEDNPASTKRLETRFLICTAGGGKYGVTYKWNAAGTDAELLASGLSESYDVVLSGGGVETRNWDYPSRADCLLCHNSAAGQALGVRTHALNKNFHYAATGRDANQLATFNALGMFDVALTAAQIEDFIEARALDDETAPIEHRVRSYLDSNCSHCHQPGSTVPHFDARLGTPLKVQGLINGIIQGHFSLGPDGRYMKPGDADLSAVHVRLSSVGNGAAMPPLAKNVVDQEAVDLLQEYLESLSGPDFVLTPQSPVARYVRLTATSEVNNNNWTSVGEFTILDGDGSAIPISEVSVHDVDSEEKVDAANAAANAIDGNPTTFWHTEYGNGGEDPMPHHLTLDVGSIRSVGGFVYVPRQGMQNGRIAVYQVHYSSDAVTWTPMTSGTWGNDAVTKTFADLVGHRKARCEIAGPSGTVGGPFDVTVVFDYDVTDFTESDLQVTGGTVTGLRGKGYYYVARISPTAANVTVSVPANAVNPGGFGSKASAALAVGFVDSQPPLPVFTGVPGQVDRPFQVSLDFGEAVTGLTAADFTVVNGTLGGIAPNGTGYTIMVNPLAPGIVKLELHDGAVTDLPGNVMGEGAVAATIRVPWVMSWEAEDGVITGGFVEETDAAASGGSYLWVPQNSRGGVLSLNTALKVTYQVTIPRTGQYLVHGLVRSDDASSDSFFIGFDGATPSDWHTNQTVGQVGTLQFHWDVANSSRAPATNPTVFNLTAGTHTLELYGRDDGTRIDRLEIRSPRPLPLWGGPALAVGGPFGATLSFSEPVTGLVAADIAITGGQILSLTGSGDTYTVQVQPTAATVTLTLPENTALDSTGSGNHQSDPYTVSFRTDYEDWALVHGVSGSAASQLADEDGDGIAKLLEFAFNLDPSAADRLTYDPSVVPGAGLPRIVVGPGPALGLQYLRRKEVPGLSYTAQFGESLDDFVDADGIPVVEDIDAAWERVTIFDASGSGAPARFGRVEVSLATP